MRVDPVLVADALRGSVLEPRFVVSIVYGVSSPYFTSHTGMSNVPGVPVQGVLSNLSGRSQEVHPDDGRSTIAGFSFDLVDVDGEVSSELRDQLTAQNEGPRRREVRVWMGFGDDFATDFARVGTYQVQDLALGPDAVYTISCADIQRQIRDEIFPEVTTRITASFAADATSMSVLDTTGFELLERTASFSEAPGQTVLYIRVKQTGEIIRSNALTGSAFQGLTRERFGTVAKDINVAAGTEDDRLPEVELYRYYEMSGPDLAYALLTGLVRNELLSNGGAETGTVGSLPTGWSNNAGNDAVIATDFAWRGDRSFKIDNTVADNSSNYQTVSLEADETYVLRARIRTSALVSADAGFGAVVDVAEQSGITGWTIHEKSTEGADPDASDPTIGIEADDEAHDWTEVSCRFTPTGSDGTARIYLQVGFGGDQEGVAWFDEVSVSKYITLPDADHVGIDPAYVDRESFVYAGLDLVDPYDVSNGPLFDFRGERPTDGKGFIEEQLMLLMGAYLSVDVYGVVHFRRFPRILATTPINELLTTSVVVDFSGIRHDQEAVVNHVVIEWNYDLEGNPTRRTREIDAGSQARNGLADVRVLEARGLRVSRFTDSLVRQRARTIFDRYGDPPLRCDVQVLPEVSHLEVGDVAGVVWAYLEDYQDTATLSRAFEIQQASIVHQTGQVDLTLFGSAREVQDVPADPAADDPLPTSWISSEGTELSTVLTMSGGSVTASGTLTGSHDMNAAASIYYYDGDLQIDAGVTVTIEANVQLRYRTLTVNGKLDGKGNGRPGSSERALNDNAGLAGWVGSTRGWPGIYYFAAEARFAVVRAGQVVGQHNAAPRLQLQVTGTLESPQDPALVGIPTDLRGTAGAQGGVILGPTQIERFGGTGGASGAGLCLIGGALSFGAAGEIDLSGDDGGSPAGGAVTLGGQSLIAGNGGGGGPGTLYVLLNDPGASFPDLGGKFTANRGDSAASGTPATDPRTFPPTLTFSGSPACGPASPGPLAAESMAAAAHVIQYIPTEQGLGESDDEKIPAPASLTASDDVTGVVYFWLNPSASLFDYIELWESIDNDRSNATLTARVATTSFAKPSAVAVTRYAWIRAVREQGGIRGYSDWHPASSTAGVQADYGGATVNGSGTLAIGLNQNLSQATANGEGVIVGVGTDGAPDYGADGHFFSQGTKYTVSRTAWSAAVSFPTQLANKKGFVVYETAETDPFYDSVGANGSNLAFAFYENGGWYFDNNTGTPQGFTPTSTMVALGWLETSTADLIAGGGLYGHPVTLTTAPGPGSEADADNTQARAIGSSALINGGFELGTTEGWDQGVFTGGTIETDAPHRGTFHLKLEDGAAQSSDPQPINPGERVLAFCFARAYSSPSPDGVGQLLVRFYNAAGTQVGTTTASPTVDSTDTSYVAMRAVATAPATAAYFELIPDHSATTGAYAFDGFGYSVIPVDSDIDALQTTNPPAEAGADRTGVRISGNVLLNGSFEVGDLDGWTEVADAFTADTTEPRFGTYHLASASNDNEQQLQNDSRLQVEEGDRIIAQGFVKRGGSAGAEARQVYIRIDWRNAADSNISYSNGAAVTSTSYTISRVVALAPANAVTAIFQIYSPAHVGDNQILRADGCYMGLVPQDADIRSLTDWGETQTFTPSWNGFTGGDPSGDMNYAISVDGLRARMWPPSGGFFGTADGTNTFYLDNLPSAIRPAGSGSQMCAANGILRNGNQDPAPGGGWIGQASSAQAGQFHFAIIDTVPELDRFGWGASGSIGLYEQTSFEWEL